MKLGLVILSHNLNFMAPRYYTTLVLLLVPNPGQERLHMTKKLSRMRIPNAFISTALSVSTHSLTASRRCSGNWAKCRLQVAMY